MDCSKKDNILNNYLDLTISTMEPETVTFSSLLKDYPSIVRGLKNLGISVPSDLQQQLLSLPNELDNTIITAPDESGKKLALILLALKRFINEEQGILLFICHSKDLSQEVHSMISPISKLKMFNLFMLESLPDIPPKCIIIGSPIKLYQLTKEIKDKVVLSVIPETDFLLSFGYGDSLHHLAPSLPSSTVYYLSCAQRGEQIDEFKSKWIKKASKIDYQPPTVQEKKNKMDSQVTHFYHVGQKSFLPITLYVTLKFGLVNPKILLLVENLREVYRYYLFLERTQIQGIGLYNHENPIDLKFYNLSLWMNGPINIMVSTAQIYEDISSSIFKQNCKKSFKQSHFYLNNLTTVVSLNLSHIPNYQIIFDSFHKKPLIVTLIESKDQEVSYLQTIIKYENQMFQSAKTNQYPIPKKELQAFKYRINDVFMNIGNHKVDWFQKLDFKRKMLKSPDLKEYFQEHTSEKQSLLKQINNLRSKLKNDAVTIPELVPLYLVPERLKNSYSQKLKQIQKEAEKEEYVPQHISKARNAVKHINMEDENPQNTDISRLKLISSRKRWKLKHGFKLKKRNLRNEKKGIFET